MLEAGLAVEPDERRADSLLPMARRLIPTGVGFGNSVVC
jgi:hypothetical protein